MSSASRERNDCSGFNQDRCIVECFKVIRNIISILICLRYDYPKVMFLLKKRLASRNFRIETFLLIVPITFVYDVGIAIGALNMLQLVVISCFTPLILNVITRLFDIFIINWREDMHNKPDICVEDYLAKTILIIDVKVSNRELLFRSENEKKDKYAALARAMRSQRSQFNVEVVPIVIGWDGSVTKFIMNYLNRLHLNRYDLSRLQIIALKKTVQMINADLRQLGDDDDETND
ncbi:hypothetical protein QR98_0100430 [Sarcoptes scabiei]|uniref:Uncharacterized protein n=1 Tax=Sarcoptes scabiei TaxID=52283 RepID=A0A132AKD8_SARSC|nr:hypothetical protein QR98_0100430 [Sarcoptes scabiei]